MSALAVLALLRAYAAAGGPLVIEEGRCGICARPIVTAHREGSISGWRLTDGCKATHGGGWRRIPPEDPRYAGYLAAYLALCAARGGA